MKPPEEAFVDAICAAPEDDMPRLVYADYLEETGESAQLARAEFIRMQCERDRLALTDPRQQGLLDREATLLREHRRAWNGPVHRRLQAGPLRGMVRARRGWVMGWAYRRGCIAEVTLRGAEVLRHSEALLTLGPLESLHLRIAPTMLTHLQGCPLLQRITELDLSGNQLTDPDLAPIRAALSGTPIRQLDLRRNRFSGIAGPRLSIPRLLGGWPAQVLLDS